MSTSSTTYIHPDKDSTFFEVLPSLFGSHILQLKADGFDTVLFMTTEQLEQLFGTINNYLEVLNPKPTVNDIVKSINEGESVSLA